MIAELYLDSFDRFPWQNFKEQILEKPNVRLWTIGSRGPVGFRLGYDIGTFRFRSWLMGVVPGHRRQGVARELLVTSNDDLRKEGYREVTCNATPDIVRLYDRLEMDYRARPAGGMRKECVCRL
jgi:GNAT superfamily N-acetyltransferase